MTLFLRSNLKLRSRLKIRLKLMTTNKFKRLRKENLTAFNNKKLLIIGKKLLRT
jgi:hypothetical protein